MANINHSEKNFLFTFVTPEKEITKESLVEEVLCPSENGELNILPQHAPLIALLQSGTLSYKKEGQWNQYQIDEGFLEVYPTGVRILTESANPLT